MCTCGKDMDTRIAEIMACLKAKDLDSLEVGTYREADDWYYMVQSYNTKPVEACRLESHEQYADIQWVLKGEERLDIVATEGLEAEEPYNAEKDVAFWKAPACMMQMILTDGGYAVLYPENAHRPGRAVGEPSPVRKIVVKVKL
ncbi:MAG: YhcH/YjgK/YiaL family protein [Clostridiales bacterium]|nr:YhcH/YjgK/YiaL family protein [Candidatus Blautia equi]